MIKWKWHNSTTCDAAFRQMFWPLVIIIIIIIDVLQDGFYEGELMNGKHGLVPSNFIEKVPGKNEYFGRFYSTTRSVCYGLVSVRVSVTSRCSILSKRLNATNWLLTYRGYTPLTRIPLQHRKSAILKRFWVSPEIRYFLMELCPEL